MLGQLLSDYLANCPTWNSLALLFVPQSLLLLGVLAGILLSRCWQRRRFGGGGDGGESGPWKCPDGPGAGVSRIVPLERMAWLSPAMTALNRGSLHAGLGSGLLPSQSTGRSVDDYPLPLSASGQRA